MNNAFAGPQLLGVGREKEEKAKAKARAMENARMQEWQNKWGKMKNGKQNMDQGKQGQREHKRTNVEEWGGSGNMGKVKRKGEKEKSTEKLLCTEKKNDEKGDKLRHTCKKKKKLSASLV